MASNLEEKFASLKPLQEKHLEILKYIKNFCEEQNIEWTLVYGSALGAKRHGGAIPWDDDADIAMTIKEYEKFRDAFHRCGDKSKFYLQECISIDGKPYLPKLRMNGTTFIEDSYIDLDMHQGIYVDIFVLKKAPKSKVKKAFGSILALYATLKVLADRGYKKRKAFLLLMSLLRLLPKNFGFKYIFNLWYKWDNENSNEIAYWTIKTRFMPLDYVFPARKIQYEDTELYAPNQMEKYLEFWFGDWKQFPSLEEIEWAQHTNNWSVSEDFRKYAPNIKDFSDEMGKRI